ncbi:hypothetical protein HNO89_003617 [Sporosarcina luteola]|nr:hypothetical protein [Sporosarcina luteola]
MKRLLVFILFLGAILSGCNKAEHNERKWFDSQDEAIQNGLKVEGISQDDIISSYDLNGELFIVFKKEIDGKLVVGVSNIANKDDQYIWYRNGAYLHAQKDITAYLSTKSFFGNEFVFYSGMTDQDSIRIGKFDSITPFIDKKTGIYYFLSSKE